MKSGNKVVFAIFDNRSSVETAVRALKSANFRKSDISVLMPALGDESTFAHSKSSKAPEGATAGAGIGALVGGTFGWLVGIGAIAVAPPLGIMLAAGPIMSALAAAGAAGALGGLTGALVGFGIPEYEAKRYEDYVKDGGILLSVHVDDDNWMGKAKYILESSGARDISSTTEVYNGTENTQAPIPPSQGTYYPDVPPYIL
ncbi:MAG: quinol:electron acceptor oxidoreductase subunit ActD [Bdellovibrionota bacterium]